MKSQAFDSKRRLTNICCFVVGLGLVKLVFAAYILSGGSLFDFDKLTGTKSVDSKMEALAKAREQQRLALQKANNEILVAQKTDTAVQSQVSDAAAQNQAQQVQNTQAVRPVQQAAQTAPLMVRGKNTPEEVEGVKPDLLIEASMATISRQQGQARRALLDNSFAEQNKETQAELGKALDTVVPTYNHDSGFSFSLVGTAHAEEMPAGSPYVRPDQQHTTAVIPAPSVENKGYVSPDTLTYKEKELNQKEEELLALQEQMNSRMEELNALEGKLGDMVKEANGAEDDKYKHLTETYANMKPRKAAEALQTLDEKIAVRILTSMKTKQSGEIFSYMEPVHAARLSKAMTKLQMN